MPVESILLESRLNDQLYNGNGFFENATSVFSPNLIGSVMEKLRVYQKVQIRWYSEATASNTFTFSGTDPNIIIKRQSGKWRDDGVSIGDEFNGNVRIDESTVLSFNGIIKSMTDNIIVVDKTSQPTVPDGSYTEARFDYYTDITSLIYKWGLVGNDEQANYISKVTENEQGYYASDISESGTSMQPLGRIRDWVTGEARVEKLSAPDIYTNIFEIYHSFIVNPYYREDLISFIEGDEIPDLFNGFNSIKYVSEMDFRTSISDPDSSKNVRVDYITGSVGWYDENFNGFNSNYEIESISFKDTITGKSISSINASGQTDVTVVVKKNNGNYNTGEKIGVYCSFMPDTEEYLNTTTEFRSNMMYDNAVITDGNTPVTNGYIMSNMQAVTDLNKFTINFTTTFSPDQINRIIAYEDPQFLIAILTGDTSKTFANSDKVMLKASVGSMINFVDLTGLIDSDSISFEIFGHDYASGKTNFVGWNEDGILANLEFKIDKARNPLINSIEQLFVAVNKTTGDMIELDSFNIPLQNSEIIAGNQIISVDTTKGYPLVDGDKFNYAKVNGTSDTYTIETGKKIPWQNWLSVDGLGIFAGANKRASNYNNVNGFTPRIAYRISMSGIGTNGNYGTDYVYIISPSFNIYNYDEPADWTGTIETFEPDTLADLGGGVLTNKRTLFRVTWEKIGITITDIADFYAIHRIEETEQNGFQLHELSSIRDFPANNPLQPLDNETTLKIYIDSGKVITECYIDPRYIDVSNVNLSARLKGTAITFVDAKQIEDGTYKTMEGTDEFKTVE